MPECLVLIFDLYAQERLHHGVKMAPGVISSPNSCAKLKHSIIKTSKMWRVNVVGYYYYSSRSTKVVGAHKHGELGPERWWLGIYLIRK
ncbi:hypothetical protein SCLCIDRAFT_778904 [Scleroderma citrinum Foug A]|uniref:Uncharacterized protein n=1 Tax=Scleroderma citrinum Foug A TaxID=1036808 RepID=A0A0C3AD53_9AGAM|nr:hypothetical protein SCLCIDRAFT_778904 [Scleroderma citrinum Foug A]